MNVFIKAECIEEACMQIDMFAPQEAGTVAMEPLGPGWMARYHHQPNCKVPPLIIVDDKLDVYVKQLVATKINLAVSWWLIASYAYYILDETLISDELFDELTQVIKLNFDRIEHINKDLITEDRLSAGSAYDLRLYPTRVMSVTQQLLEKMRQAYPNKKMSASYEQLGKPLKDPSEYKSMARP